MQKETETQETIVFFVTFSSLVAFRLEGGSLVPPGYTYGSIRHNLSWSAIPGHTEFFNFQKLSNHYESFSLP